MIPSSFDLILTKMASLARSRGHATRDKTSLSAYTDHTRFKKIYVKKVVRDTSDSPQHTQSWQEDMEMIASRPESLELTFELLRRKADTRTFVGGVSKHFCPFIISFRNGRTKCAFKKVQ